ncbi:hypothetical protein OG948_54065 (plasmid) [Embleya sp. NBC_00888]|nr:hypothetical protein OG948_54065 [Embleya sp. NBC_00888]
MNHPTTHIAKLLARSESLRGASHDSAPPPAPPVDTHRAAGAR